MSFDALLDLEPVQHKVGIPDYEGQVPDTAIKAISTAIGSGPQKVSVGSDQAMSYKSVLKAALKIVAPDKMLNTRDKYNDDGEYIGFSFSAGAPRGRKAKVTNEEDTED